MNSFDFGIGNMSRCVQDILDAQTLGSGPTDIQTFWGRYDKNYPQLLRELQEAKVSLPVEYQENIVKPLIKLLQSLGAIQLQAIFTNRGVLSAKYRNYLKEVIPELVYAVLTAAASSDQTKAFQELVSDLYQGFLSAEARNVDGTRIKPPDLGIIPPLVKWGSPAAGPYTLPVDTVKRLGVNVAVVSMPPIYSQRGAVAWAALAHETAGHDILHADTGLVSELSGKVYEAVFTQSQNRDLAIYWANCIDETASDVLGILNMGPAAGIGVITYFRGVFGGRLRTTGSWDDPHPVDILRGYLAAHVVRQLKFSDREKWADRIVAETDNDLGPQKVTVYPGNSGQNLRISREKAKRSAEVVAEAITKTPLIALEGHALGQIQNWQDKDDQLAVTIALGIRNRESVPKEARGAGFYAAHVIAGATYESLRADVDLPLVFQSMITYLASMNRENPIWIEKAVRRPVVGRRVVSLRHELPASVVAHRVSSLLTTPAVQAGILERFDPPGGVNDGLDDSQLQAWSDEIQSYFDWAKAGRPQQNDGPRHQFFVPTREAVAADAVTKAITWRAFPRIVAVNNPSIRRFEVADRSRDMQDEYCEWSVKRNGERKITKVTFTCEGPEYWNFLARIDPGKVLKLYRQYISPEVVHEDLFPNGNYNPSNKWNNSTTNGAMHLIQKNNTLSAEIELAGGASIVRAKPDGSFKVDRDELIRCSQYGAPERNSDPTIGAEVNALARLGAKVTLLNPVGLYFSDFDPQGWETPDGTDPKEFWTWTRGSENTRVRAEFAVPLEKGYTVGDIRINDRKIKYGSEITDFIHMKLVGVAQGIGEGVHPIQGCRGRPFVSSSSLGFAASSQEAHSDFSTRTTSVLDSVPAVSVPVEVLDLAVGTSR